MAYRKSGISNVLTRASLLDPDEVMLVCDAIDEQRNAERRTAISAVGSSTGSSTGSSSTSGGSSIGGDATVVVAVTEPWPRVRNYLEVHDSYTEWQTDPAVWCYGGAEARVSLRGVAWGVGVAWRVGWGKPPQECENTYGIRPDG